MKQTTHNSKSWFSRMRGNGGTAVKPANPSELMLAPDKFRFELEREMLRSDRSGVKFTLLLLNVVDIDKGRAGCPGELSPLSHILEQCLRRTDIMGLHTGGANARLAVLLYNTLPFQIKGILEKLQSGYTEILEQRNGSEPRNLELAFEVYIYPKEPGNAEDDVRAVMPPGNNGNGSNGNGSSAHGSNGHGMRGGSQLSAFIDADPETAQKRLSRLSVRHNPQMYIPSTSRLFYRPLPTWKRGLDIVGASLMILIGSPLILAIALCIKLSSKGPVLFRQDRVGYSGKLFKCLKFRSMRVDYDVNEHRKHLEKLIESSRGNSKQEEQLKKLDSGNPAITWIGKLIRPTHLDELPQLFNVLKGEMSLVGPRPCIPYEAAHYQIWCHRRFDSIPGITGLWQVKGKNRTTFKQMIQYDIDYSKKASLLFDILILFMTIPTILSDVLEVLVVRKDKTEKTSL